MTSKQTPNPGKQIAIRGWPGAFWNWLTQPAASIQRRDHRRSARLISAMLLVVLVAVTLNQMTGGEMPISIWVLAVVGYVLSRTRYYKLAAFLAVGFLSYPSFANIFTETEQSSVTLISHMAWISMPIILSSLLFPVSGIAVISAIYFFIILSLPSFTGLETRNIFPALGYTTTLSILIILTMRQRDQLEKDRQREINKLNEDLEFRVIQRTAQLAAANQELEAFSYSVSHDLRAPLRGIEGYSKLLLDEHGENLGDDGKTFLQRINKACLQMGQLIDGLLTLSTLSRTEIQYAPVNLSGLVEEIARSLKDMNPGREVEFHIAEEVSVYGDQTLMRVALENLLNNAWKFTSRSSAARIEFGTIQQAGETAVFVRDNGAGFEMAYADKLFEVFQRLHGVEEFEGIGVGLATVQRIIHRHGGRVWAEGAVDHGATFYFVL